MPKYVVDDSLPATVTEKHWCIGPCLHWASITVNAKNTWCYLYPLLTKPDALTGPSDSRHLGRLDRTLLSTSPLPQVLLRKANAFYHCAWLSRLAWTHAQKVWDFFSCVHTYTCLSYCTCGYATATPSCSLGQNSFFTEKLSLSANLIPPWCLTTTVHGVYLCIFELQLQTKVLSPPMPEMSQSPCASVHLSGFWKGSIAYPYTSFRSELRARGIPCYNRKKCQQHLLPIVD